MQILSVILLCLVCESLAYQDEKNKPVSEPQIVPLPNSMSSGKGVVYINPCEFHISIEGPVNEEYKGDIIQRLEEVSSRWFFYKGKACYEDDKQQIINEILIRVDRKITEILPPSINATDESYNITINAG